MTDIAHDFGADLSLSATGDLATVSGGDAGRQRVLRRLLTNAGDYVWNPGYGAGLAGFVAQPAAALRIAAVVRGQIFREPAVARTPEPVIAVAEAGPAAFRLDLRYADAPSGTATSGISLPIGGA